MSMMAPPIPMTATSTPLLASRVYQVQTGMLVPVTVAPPPLPVTPYGSFVPPAVPPDVPPDVPPAAKASRPFPTRSLLVMLAAMGGVALAFCAVHSVYSHLRWSARQSRGNKRRADRPTARARFRVGTTRAAGTAAGVATGAATGTAAGAAAGTIVGRWAAAASFKARRPAYLGRRAEASFRRAGSIVTSKPTTSFLTTALGFLGAPTRMEARGTEMGLEEEGDAPILSIFGHDEPYVPVPYECSCGFTCGTLPVWERHVARCVTHKSKRRAHAACACSICVRCARMCIAYPLPSQDAHHPSVSRPPLALLQVRIVGRASSLKAACRQGG